MTAVDIIVTLIVLLGLFVLGYCAVTKKTLIDLWRELMEIFTPTEEISIYPETY